MAGRQYGEGEEAVDVAGFFEAGGGGMPQPPLAQEFLAPLLDLLWRVGVDDVVVVDRALVMQPLGRVGEQDCDACGPCSAGHVAPMAASHSPAGAAIDDQEFGPAQSAPDEVVENRPPSFRRFAAEHFLAVLAHAKPMASHGVVSTGALTPESFGLDTPETTPPSISANSATALCFSFSLSALLPKVRDLQRHRDEGSAGPSRALDAVRVVQVEGYPVEVYYDANSILKMADHGIHLAAADSPIQ